MTSPTSFDPAHSDRRNRQAWDRLYARRRELIWGRRPVGFLDAYLDRLDAALDPRSRVLDAACGEGRNLPALNTLPGELHACDASEHALAKAESWLPSSIHWHHCELERMPFDDASFDFVLACDVLQTLPDLGAALDELNRIVKPDGYFLCNIPNLEDGIADEQMVPLRPGEFLYQDQYFFRFLDVDEACDALQAAGFEIIEHARKTWVEEPHPGYRQDVHRHTSWVYLARRMDG